MASSAILRSAARALRLHQPLEQQRHLLARRLFSGSAPSERGTNPPSGTRPSSSMEQKSRFNEEKDAMQRILKKIDMISDAVDRQERLLKELQSEINEDQKNGRVIDVTPWVVSISTVFLLVTVYNYM